MIKSDVKAREKRDGRTRRMKRGFLYTSARPTGRYLRPAMYGKGIRVASLESDWNNADDVL